MTREKKIKGRKRHIIVDVVGNLLAIVVHSAGIQDRRGARLPLIRIATKFETISKIWADGGYSGKTVSWAKEMFDHDLEIVKKIEGQKGFSVLPRRWVVERSFAWLIWRRRFSKDYEHNPKSSEAFVHIASIDRILIKLHPL